MTSRYHWVTAGIDAAFNGFIPTAQPLAMDIPAGGTLKRFQSRLNHFGARTMGTDENFVFDINLRMSVAFTLGPYSGRTIYETDRDVPFQAVTFVPISGNSRYAWYHAGDNELGFNEGCSYGKSSGAAAKLQFSYFFSSFAPHDYTNLRGEWSFRCAALYYL